MAINLMIFRPTRFCTKAPARRAGFFFYTISLRPVCISVSHTWQHCTSAHSPCDWEGPIKRKKQKKKGNIGPKSAAKQEANWSVHSW